MCYCFFPFCFGSMCVYGHLFLRNPHLLCLTLTLTHTRCLSFPLSSLHYLLLATTPSRKTLAFPFPCSLLLLISSDHAILSILHRQDSAERRWQARQASRKGRVVVRRGNGWKKWINASMAGVLSSSPSFVESLIHSSIERRGRGGKRREEMGRTFLTLALICFFVLLVCSFFLLFPIRTTPKFLCREDGFILSVTRMAKEKGYH